MYGVIERHRDRVDLDLLQPTVRWREAVGSRGSA
jgi:hypothetical protein